MLRISKLADYGTVVMVVLVKRAPELCSARDLALQTHLTIPTVSKLLKRLTLAGLLSSVRGAAGGYRLQRDARDISVAQVIYALGSPRGLTECSSEPNVCALQGMCHIQSHWRLISQAITQALEGVSLQALAEPTLSPISLQHLKLFAGGNHG